MSRVFKFASAAALSAFGLLAVAPAPMVSAAEALGAAVLATTEQGSLTVRVTDADSNEGVVWVGLYDSEAGYDAGDEIVSQSVRADVTGVELVFEDVAPGQYAIIAFHDENRDGDFNSNMFGIPSERYGFSNNPRPRFRAATWNEAVFALEAGEAEMVINLQGAF